MILREMILCSYRLEITVEAHCLAETYRSSRPVPRSARSHTILCICVEECYEDRRLDNCHFVFFEFAVEQVL